MRCAGATILNRHKPTVPALVAPKVGRQLTRQAVPKPPVMELLYFQQGTLGVPVGELEVYWASAQVDLTIDNDVVGTAVASSEPQESELCSFLALLCEVVVPK